MQQFKVHIKNMVCPRCIMAIKEVFNRLDIPFIKVELGKVYLPQALDSQQRTALSEKIEPLGFELLGPATDILISTIKTLIIDQIHYSKEPLAVNFSVFLSERLHYNYSHLSRLFSSVEGITIERFITLQKIERVKGFLFYDELTLSEISFLMNYSSVAYLSSQFKKETGMTPTAFKKNRDPQHKSLDKI
ncbi:MAG: helix-turn-helix domain-containing protein [Lewinellaceae bacterium]|nr:helix-turn-helix domain-containing protein [Lewinellaceae bacterium]